MSNTKPIGVAYEDQDIIGADFVYSAGELGYTAAAQGTVTQATSKSTAVTLNKSAGQITMNNATIPANDAVSFTLNNSLISGKDLVVVNISSGATTPAQYTTYVNSMSSGAAIITVRNLLGTTSPADALVLNFAIIHCT